MSRRGIRIVVPVAALIVSLWLLARGCGDVEAPSRTAGARTDASASRAEGEVTRLPAPSPSGSEEAPPESDREETGPAASEPRERPGLVVAGRVYRQDGITPLAGKFVSLSQGDDRRYVAIAGDGSFRFAGLAEGAVRLRVRTSDEAAGGEVTTSVVAGDEDVRIVLAPRGVLHLVVVDAASGELVVSHLRVVEMLETGDRTLLTASGGLASHMAGLDLRPGRPLRFRVVADGYLDSEPETITYRADEPVQRRIVRLQPDPSADAVLVLALRLPDGTVPEKASVTRFREGGSSGRGHVVEGGRLVLRIHPGEVDLEIGVGAGADGVALAPIRFQAKLVRGERIRRDLTFRPGGFVRVRGPGEKLPSLVWLGHDGHRALRSGKTEEVDGVAWTRYGPLAAGAWRLTDGRRCRPADFEVRAGVVTEVVLEPPDED